jgi:stage V sporulation protein AE
MKGSVIDAVDKEGFIGIFKGGFTSSSVGISAALILSYIASWFFGPKMKS